MNMANTKSLQLSIKVYIDEEQAREIFEANDLKFTKKRFKEVIEMIEQDTSALDDVLQELFDEIIVQEYES